MIKFPKSVLTFYFRNLFHYAKGWPLLYLLLSAFDTASWTVIPAFFIKMVVSSLENAPAVDAFVNIIPIAVTFFAIRACTIFGSIMRWIVFDNCIRYRAYNKISEDLYNYVFNQSIKFYSDSMPGKINSQINSIATGFYDTLNMIMGSAVATLCAFILAFGGLFAIGWQYALVISIALLGRIGWGLWRIKYALRASARASGASNHLHGRLLDALSNFLAVKTFAHDDWERRCARPHRKEYEPQAGQRRVAGRLAHRDGDGLSE